MLFKFIMLFVVALPCGRVLFLLARLQALALLSNWRLPALRGHERSTHDTYRRRGALPTRAWQLSHPPIGLTIVVMEFSDTSVNLVSASLFTKTNFIIIHVYFFVLIKLQYSTPVFCFNFCRVLRLSLNPAQQRSLALRACRNNTRLRRHLRLQRRVSQ